MRTPCGFATMRVFAEATSTMPEANPIRARIADLRDRVESLRGYL